MRELNPELNLWDVLVDPARKIRIGNKLYFGENEELIAEVIDNTTSRGRTLRFLYDGTHEEFQETLEYSILDDLNVANKTVHREKKEERLTEGGDERTNDFRVVQRNGFFF